MEQKQFEAICKKLDRIAIIIAAQGIEDKNEKIYFLKKAGLTSDEISPIVGLKGVRDTNGWKRK